MHVAEGKGDGAPAELPLPSATAASSVAPSASGAPSASAAPRASPAPGATPFVPQAFTNDPPDPAPLRQADQYEYTFRYEQGAVRLLGVRAVHYKQPIVTARRVGRFAFELWIGRELIERVRFDFPLLGADEPVQSKRPLHAAPSLAGGAYTTRILIPAAARARSARLVDRKTRGEAKLPWPPEPASVALNPAPASSR
jgi:hypothetical protein